MTEYKNISVICPIYNEEKHIERFLDTVLMQDYPVEHTEVLLLDGMSTDRTRELIGRYIRQYSHIRLLDNPQKIVPFALNKGIRAAKGDIVIRLDAHCEYPNNYFSRLVEELQRLKADNVGGICYTLPANDSAEAHAVAIGSSHPFGVGSSIFRIGTNRIMEVDTVPFGCYWRKTFDEIGYFDEELTRNQDDEFNGRLINHGGKIYIIPDVVINYTARDSFDKMRKMYYQYGLFKPMVNRKLGSPATIRQFVPALFICGLVVGLVISLLYPPFWYVYLGVLAVYLLTALLTGCYYAVKRRKPALLLLMPYTFLNIHFSYGLGYLTGIARLWSKKNINVNYNR